MIPARRLSIPLFTLRIVGNWEVNFWQLTGTMSRDKRLDYFRFADHASVIHKRAIFDPRKI
jgi:hypothetical protein